MSMTVRKLNSSLWGEIRGWYRDNPFVEVFMSKDCGYVAFFDGKPLACGFLVETNCKFAMMEHLQVNPSANKISQGRALIAVAGHIIESAKNLGYKCILGMTPKDNNSVIKMHKKVFKGLESDADFKIVYKVLWGE